MRDFGLLALFGLALIGAIAATAIRDWWRVERRTRECWVCAVMPSLVWEHDEVAEVSGG